MALSALLAGPAMAAPRFATPRPAQPHAEDHLLVKFRPEARALLGPDACASTRALLSRLGMPAGAELVESGFARLAGKNRKAEAGLDLAYPLLLALPPGLTVEDGLAQLQGHPLLDYAEPDGIGSGGNIYPSDPEFPLQWHHYNTGGPSAVVRGDIHTPEAWEITRGATGVVVAVLDSGLNTNLADFAGRVVPGYDFVNNDANPADDHNHGTAVASALCASSDNTNDVAGVDWRCRLMPLKVLNSANNGYYSDWADAIYWAVSNGADVINLSAGGSSTSQTLAAAIDFAIARDVVLITITHNDGTATVRFPGRHEPCITVGATDQADELTGFSNYGPAVDLCAPGIDIRIITRNGAVQSWWGTSFAAPLVAGAAALLVAVNPALTHEQVRTLLCAGAEDQVGDPAEDTAGFDNYHGWGRLNVFHSLLLARTTLRPAQSPLAGGWPRFQWNAPPNATNRQPYRVEHACAPTGTWTTRSDQGTFLYNGTQATWQATGFAPTEMLRLGVHLN